MGDETFPLCIWYSFAVFSGMPIKILWDAGCKDIITFVTPYPINQTHLIVSDIMQGVNRLMHHI